MGAFEKGVLCLADARTSATTTTFSSLGNNKFLFVFTLVLLVGRTSAHGNHNKMVIPEGQAISDDPIVSFHLLDLVFRSEREVPDHDGR